MNRFSNETQKLGIHIHECAHTHARTQAHTQRVQDKMQKHTITLQPAAPWAPLWTNRTCSASPLCLRPLSTDSCFLTKPTPLRADPVIMRLCPGIAGQPGSNVNSSELTSWTGPLPPRTLVQREQKLRLAVWGEERISPQGGKLMSRTKTKH